MNGSKTLAIFGFVLLGLISRLIPHPPNFVALNSIALFSTFYFRNRWLSFGTVLITLFFSDILLGFHSTIPYVYFGFALTILLGYALNCRMSFVRIPIISVTSSLLFFFVSNFGVWMTANLYPKTFQGLNICYLAAIPFLTNQIIGDLTYSLLLFGYLYFLNMKNEDYEKSFLA